MAIMQGKVFIEHTYNFGPGDTADPETHWNNNQEKKRSHTRQNSQWYSKDLSYALVDK